MKKKVVAVLMTCAMAVTMMAGCGGGDTAKEQGSAETSTDKDEKVEITFWDNYATPQSTERFKDLIAKFESENPNITVKHVPLPSDQARSKYDVAIQSGSTPDCGVIYQYWMNDFIIQDALEPLDNYVAEWENYDQMLETFQKSIKDTAPDGKLYGLAQSVVPPTLWYNTELFEKAGLEAPTTWDEVFEDTKKLTDKENGVYGFSIRGGAGSSQQLEQMLYQYSGITEMFDEDGNSTINDPLHVKFLEEFASLYNEYTPESDITNASTEMISAFDSGSAAMIFHNIASYAMHKETLGDNKVGAIVNLKSKDGDSVLVSNGVVTLSVFKNSEHPDEAFKFISFLSEHENNSYYCEKFGSLPCNKVAMEDEWVKESKPVQAAADTLLNQETKIATLPVNVTGYFDLHSNTLAKDFQNVLLGNETAQQYLDKWADQMTALKKQYDENVVNK